MVIHMLMPMVLAFYTLKCIELSMTRKYHEDRRPREWEREDSLGFHHLSQHRPESERHCPDILFMCWSFLCVQMHHPPPTHPFCSNGTRFEVLLCWRRGPTSSPRAPALVATWLLAEATAHHKQEKGWARALGKGRKQTKWQWKNTSQRLNSLVKDNLYKSLIMTFLLSSSTAPGYLFPMLLPCPCLRHCLVSGSLTRWYSLRCMITVSRSPAPRWWRLGEAAPHKGKLYSLFVLNRILISLTFDRKLWRDLGVLPWTKIFLTSLLKLN